MSEKRSPLTALKSVGPAIIVAAVVLGPGSILVSSKVGAVFGYSAISVLALAIILLIAMVRLAAHVGLAYERTPCQEIAHRLGKPTAIALGLTVFLIIACFQTSNNIAVATALDPLSGGQLPSWAPATVIIVTNAIVLLILFRLPDLYKRIEKIMKVLVLLMILAFIANAIVAAPAIFKALKNLPAIFPEPDPRLFKLDFIDALEKLKNPRTLLTALIATTFSVAAAFYQAYLVRERGWTLADSKRVRSDSLLGILVLGAISLLIMVTSAAAFYGQNAEIDPPIVSPGMADVTSLPAAATLNSASDVAAQLEPLFGVWAKLIFGFGIFAAAISSFLVNAMIGGTIMSDSLGRGSKIGEAWPRNLTAVALVFGMAAGLLSVTTGFSHVDMITFAQALTVVGVPALACALLYLGTRKELTGDKKFSRMSLCLAFIGTAVVIFLAIKKAIQLFS